MDNTLMYFVNSQGQKTVLVTEHNKNYWKMKGQYGFTAPQVEIFTTKFASGKTKYDGKAILPRTCGMKMICKGSNSAERDKIFYSMLDILLDQYGTGEGKLYIKRSNGQWVYLNCVYSSGMDAKDEYEKFRLFTIEFYAADPFFYWSKRFPFPYNQAYKDEPKSGEITVTNPFDIVCYPKIHLYNPVDQNPLGEQTHGTIANLTTAETIEFYGVNDLRDRNTFKFYEDVDIITEPKNKSVVGDMQVVSLGDTQYFYGINCQEIIVGGLETMNLSLAPGKNIISYDFKSIFAYKCFIDVVKKYAGA